MSRSNGNFEKMTETPVLRLIALLSIPTILSMLVSTVYNMADTAFVGTLGTSASGAVGIVFGFMAILQAVGFLFGQGAGSCMARKLGERDQEAAETYASLGFFGSFFCAIIIGVLCAVFLDPLVRILGSTETIAPYAKAYIECLLVSAPFCSSSFTLNNLLRYEGKAKLGMVGMMTGALLNIGGDALFIFVFKLGIFGAGLSTAVSQIISFSILLSMFIRGKTECRISFKRLSFNLPVIGNILATGFPSLLRQALGSITTVILNHQAAVYGDAAVAAMSIVSRISFFIFSIGLGIGQGFQPVSSFNYGAKKYSRVRKAFIVTLTLATVTTTTIAMIALFNADNLIHIFRDDPVVIQIGTRALKLQCATVVLLPLSMATEMLYQSTGKKAGASALSSFRGGVVFIPALLILAKVRGLQGIQEAQPASYVITAFASILFIWFYFRRLPSEDVQV